MTSTLHDLMTSTDGLPCRTVDPALWFSDYQGDRARAAGLCSPCPLLAACQTFGLKTRQEWGVWGGIDLTAVETYCGTDRGYLIHTRNGEIACEPCREVHAVSVEGRRRRQLEVEHAKGGSPRGYGIHLRMGEAACEACLAAQAAKSAECRARAQQRREAPRALSVAPGATESVRGAPEGVQPASLAA